MCAVHLGNGSFFSLCKRLYSCTQFRTAFDARSSGKGVRCMKIERCIVMTLRKFSRLGNKLDIHHQTSHIQRTSIDSFFHLQVLCFITASETLLNSFLGNGTQCRRRAQQKHHIINTVRGDSWIL